MTAAGEGVSPRGKVHIVGIGDDGLDGMTAQARRLLEAGGAYLNNERLTRDVGPLGRGVLVAGSLIVLRSGRRNVRLVRFV